MRGNTINVTPRAGTVKVVDTLTQYDYGQILKFSGAVMPETYEVHFANDETGECISVQGNENGVAIPDELLESGQDVFVWVFGHAGNDDGETVYHFIIKVNKRGRPSDNEPITPAEGVKF